MLVKESAEPEDNIPASMAGMIAANDHVRTLPLSPEELLVC